MNTVRHILHSVCLIALPLLAQAQTPTIQIDNDTVTLTGSVDAWKDREPLWQAIRSRPVLILKGVSVDSVDSALKLAEVVGKARVTTVADGDCGLTCMPLFAAGEKRLWGHRPGAASPVLTLGNRPLPASVNVGLTSTDPGLYQLYRRQLSIPFSLLNNYVNSRSTTNGLRFVAPGNGLPEGEGMECSDIAKPAECKRHPELQPLSARIFTSAAPYPLGAAVSSPAASAMQAPANVMTAEKAGANGMAGSVPLQAGDPLMARNVSQAEGLSGITTSFNLEGRIFAYLPVAWTNGGASGHHRFETRWYRGEQLVHQSPAQSVGWPTTPGAAWYAMRAAELGKGDYKVDFWLDGRVVASKSFSIRSE